MTGEGISSDEIELKFVEQEHRTLRVWYNFYRYALSKPVRKNYKSASIQAVISWFFSPAGIISITLPIGALAGAYFAWNANILLDSQNRLLDKQNELIVSQNIEMRASRETQIFVSQLGPLIDLVTRSKPNVLDDSGSVQLQLAGRISTFTQTLGPYVKLEAYGQEHILSPERARLMTALYSLGFPLEKLPHALDFGFPQSAFENVSFQGASLVGINLSGSNLRRASFVNAKLNSCDFSNALLPSPDAFRGADLRNCNFTGAFVDDGNWINEVSTRRLEINPQTLPCPDSVKSTQVDISRWEITSRIIDMNGNNTAVHRVKPNGSIESMNAVLSELDDLDQNGVFDQDFDPAEFEKDHGRWVTEAVEALNSQKLHSDKTSPEPRISISRGEFLTQVASHGIPIEIFVRLGADFKGVQLENDRQPIQLSGSLSGINLAGGNLRSVSFKGADLDSADFRGTVLPEAKAFSGANLHNAKFEGAKATNRSWLQDLVSLEIPPKNFSESRYEIEIETTQYPDCDDPSKIHIEETGYRITRTSN